MGYCEQPRWPLNSKVDLSSGFGDVRPGRFHAGVDLRTGGKTGVRVYSSVDGYVWRIKMSYRGSGKGLYIKGTDGKIYVFYHLSRFNEEIRRAVRKAQNRAGRYYVDLYFPSDSIPVHRGQFVAYSGITGTKAPHLHFEVRSPENRPINPLSNGYSLDDRQRPVFERIGIQLVDDHSLLPYGKRRALLPVHGTGKRGNYQLDSVLYLSSPFGVLADCYDRMRQGGMRQSVYKLTLAIDGRQYYMSAFDSLAFELGPLVELEYDHKSIASGKKRVRRLFHETGNSYFGSRAFGEHGGVVGSYGEISEGLHEAVITAEDNFENKSELHFKFLWGPPAQSKPPASMSDGTLELGYQVVEDGLIVTAETTSDVFLEVYGGNQRLGSESTGRLCDDGRFRFFMPPRSEYRQVDSLVVRSIIGGQILGSLPLTLAAVGYEDNETFAVGNSIVIQGGHDNFYRPRFIAVEQVTDMPTTVELNSASFRILPEVFVTRDEFGISLALSPEAKYADRSGLCWWDDRENEWIWIDEDSRDNSRVAGPSNGGGLFASLFDIAPPTIKKLNVREGQTLKTLRPLIEFILEDDLSGIEDDRNIDIRINGQWLIPEYHPATGQCVAEPYELLKPGKCLLTIDITDRAGNRIELSRTFYVE
ncbi:MAG: hypothetical protein DRP45_02020 [Candidatus Zixiibacteriota bacterium]|nr:MAG: hypothetical protein DRP45_02020 [candidate division Zixibacteria bacterium]